MKGILNSVLALSLLVPAFAVAEQEVSADQLLLNQRVEQLKGIAANERAANEAAAVRPSMFQRAKNSVGDVASRAKSAVVGAGSVVAEKAKNAGSYVADKARNAGSSVVSKAKAAKDFVANEYAQATGVKGKAIFAAKAAATVGVTALVGYLVYKGYQYVKASSKNAKLKAAAAARKRTADLRNGRRA